ncbi:GtrA family protein [Patescibacteria group bacterium]|nr:GtrA family protein [Patescibacteria group bacterium]
MEMKKLDVIIALIIGELTAIYFAFLFKNIYCGVWALCVIFPILSIVCLWIAYLIGKKYFFILQGAKFLLIGVLGTLIDLGVLNILIWISGISSGFLFPVFKGISFVVANCSKYFGHKFWVFEKKEMIGAKKEFGKFFLVSLGGLIINVTTASLVVNLIQPQFGLSETIWANIGGIIAAFATIIWNFLGYKFVVFKK